MFKNIGIPVFACICLSVGREATYTTSTGNDGVYRDPSALHSVVNIDNNNLMMDQHISIHQHHHNIAMDQNHHSIAIDSPPPIYSPM
jgi:hypothetical protein